METLIENVNSILTLTDKQKELYVQEYLYDELCQFDLHNQAEMIEYFGTSDVLSIAQGVIAYPLSHKTVDDMFKHMDDKYFHLLTDEQIWLWELSRESN